jgi:hypothetical protein
MDVTADQYPYIAGSTILAAVVQNGALGVRRAAAWGVCRPRKFSSRRRRARGACADHRPAATFRLVNEVAHSKVVEGAMGMASIQAAASRQERKTA